MVEEREPVSPDHVVAVGDDFAGPPDKSQGDGKVQGKHDGGDEIKRNDNETKSDPDDSQEKGGDLFQVSTTLNGHEYAAIESGSESDFGDAPSWLKASGGGGGASGDGGLLDRMFSQEYVQLSLDADDDIDVLLGGGSSSNLAGSKSLSEIRRTLFPDESLSSSSSSSSAERGDDKDGSRRSRPTSLQSSIDKIREEASRVDAAVALHRLETVQLELDETRRQLHNRRQELEEQRAVLRLKDDRLATLELERDLYKADARVRSATKPSHWRRDRSINSASTGSVSEASRSHIPKILQRHHHPPLHEESSSCLSSKASEHVVASPSSDSSDSSASTDSSSANRGNRLSDSNLRRTSALEAKCLVGTTRLASILISRRKREKYRQETPQRHGSRADTTAQLPPVAHRVRSPSHKKPAATTPEEWIENHQHQSFAWSLEEQVEELQNRLRASMETADELRKRLASIHGFYERTIRILQERHQALEEQRRQYHHHRRHADETTAAQEWRAKLDHVKQAKKRAIHALEAKLREKDDEIERLSTLAYDEI